MEFNKNYCMERAAFHEREASEAKKDAELSLEDSHDMFMNLYETHTRYAKAWREALESMQ